MVFGLIQGCTQTVVDSTPAKVLESYIQISFNAKSPEDKKRMEALLTGDTLVRLAAWSTEQFEKAFVETKKKFERLRVLDTKKVNDSEVVLTYELSYQEGPADQVAQVTQRKLCTVVLVDGGWKIKEVRSIRESIEYLKELSLP
jgi:putative component of toxin-antitoxin plasmid stabilization module